ncbi:MAG TPA: serine hydrolase domain-containing protein, partial [Caulobacteraceae bacterium]
MKAIALPLGAWFVGARIAAAQEAASAQPPSPDLVDQLNRVLDARPVNGAFLFARGDRVLLSAARGRDPRRTLAADTPFPIASVSKQFTAAAFLKLCESGRLAVTDPVSKVFPEAPADKRDVTFHQLLTHTAGFPPNAWEPEMLIDRERARAAIMALPLISPPAYQYGNADYMLVALAIERLSGRTLDDELKRQFFDPLGMTSTGFPGAG